MIIVNALKTSYKFNLEASQSTINEHRTQNVLGNTYILCKLYHFTVQQ